MWTLFGILLGITSSAFTKDLFVRSDDVTIIGGKDAPEGIAPYQVSLQEKGVHTCGGSILNDRWVVTAARCVIDLVIDQSAVLVGTNHLSSGGQKYSLEKKIFNKDYELSKNDIGLVKTTQAIVMSEKVQPIKLPEVNTEPGAKLLVTGWGLTKPPPESPLTLPIDLNATATSHRPQTPDALQMLYVKAIGLTECQKSFFLIDVTSVLICTFTKRGEGICNGDIGGPLVEEDRLVGIASCGMNCADGFPDIFTRVYSFLDWINSNMAN